MGLYFNYMKKDQNIIIYRTKNGAIELQGDVKAETLWATQAQIVQLFEIDQSVVSRHIRNIFKDGEVNKKSNMQKMHIANSDKPVIFYSFDMVLAVGLSDRYGYFFLINALLLLALQKNL